MNSNKNTFDAIWQQMEPNARELGIRDGDLPRIRSKVKSLFISAGWANKEGVVEFMNDLDAATALQAARKELERTARLVASEEAASKLVARAGSTPTKAQVLSASSSVSLHSTGVSSGSFSPRMGSVGDRCPRCHGSMEPVGLANGKTAIYCTKDRVVLPLSPEDSAR